MKGKSGSKVWGKWGARGEKNSFSKRFAPLAFSFSKLLCYAILLFKGSVLRTASVSPLDRDKDIVLDPRKMHPHFSVILCELLHERQKRIKSLGKVGCARGEEQLFKAVCSPRILFQ